MIHASDDRHVDSTVS